jgi:hypothetical protein
LIKSKHYDGHFEDRTSNLDGFSSVNLDYFHSGSFAISGQYSFEGVPKNEKIASS